MINFRKIGSRFRLDDDSYSPQSSNEIKYREGESNCSRASPPPSLLFSNHEHFHPRQRTFLSRYFFHPYLPPQTYPSTIVLTNTYPLYLKATRPEQPSDLDPGPVARRPLSGEKKRKEERKKERKRPLSDKQ